MNDAYESLSAFVCRVGWWMQGWFRWSWVPLWFWRWNGRFGPYRAGVRIYEWGNRGR